MVIIYCFIYYEKNQLVIYHVAKKKKRIDLAMLHDVELPQPGLIERIAGSVYNMAKSILFCKDQHRVQKAFHCFSGLNKSGTCIMNDKQFEKNE